MERYTASGAELIMGTGNFIAPKTLEVRLSDGGTRLLAGDQVIVNVGTHATIPNVAGSIRPDRLPMLNCWNSTICRSI
jgi:pyruvate/2-oxoglutarate dehydrogenase complex dihydrolipoamide dehydrogenase (E3) component